MKRATALAALTALSLCLTSVPALANDSGNTSSTQNTMLDSQKGDNTQLISAKYDNLEFDKFSYCFQGEFIKLLGYYPLIKNVPTLSNSDENSIINDIDEALMQFEENGVSGEFTLDYKIEEFNRYAKVTITISELDKPENIKFSHTHYIDKVENKEITAHQFNSVVTEEEQAPASESEIVLLPLRLVTEGLASESNIAPVSLEWNESTQSVSLTFGDKLSTVIVGRNVCIFNGKMIDLEQATILQNGSIYVSSDYFTKVFGATVEILNENGKPLARITLPDTETTEESETTDSNK